MHITHSYVGTTKGRFRCLFFLLLQDYIDAEAQFQRGLDKALERFARKMGDEGVLVRPFTGDIEGTRAHVLDKPWTPAQREEVARTPGLLMIDVDFDAFSPQEHPWLFLNLGSSHGGKPLSSEAAADILTHLAEAVQDAETDVFEAARDTIREGQFSAITRVFEAKPGIFGFKVDLIQGAALVHQLWLKLTKERRVYKVEVDPEGWTQCPRCQIRFTTRSKGSWDGFRHTSCGAYLSTGSQQRRLTTG